MVTERDAVFARYSRDARKSVVDGEHLARAVGAPAVDPSHLAAATLGSGDLRLSSALHHLGRPAASIHAVESMGVGPPPTSGQLAFSPIGRDALVRALRESLTSRPEIISSHHLLLGCLGVWAEEQAAAWWPASISQASLRSALEMPLHAAVLASPHLSGAATFYAETNRAMPGLRRARVWDTLLDRSLHPALDPDTIRSYAMAGTGRGVGTQYCCIENDGDVPRETFEIVTAFDERAYLALRGVSSGSPQVEYRFSLDDAGDGCRVNLGIEIRSTVGEPGAWRRRSEERVGPLLSGMLDRLESVARRPA